MIDPDHNRLSIRRQVGLFRHAGQFHLGRAILGRDLPQHRSLYIGLLEIGDARQLLRLEVMASPDSLSPAPLSPRDYLISLIADIRSLVRWTNGVWLRSSSARN